MVLVRQLLKILTETPTPTPSHDQTPVSTSAGEINEDLTPSTSVEITNNEMANAPSPEGPSVL